MNKLVIATILSLILILSTYGILAEASDDSNSDIPKSCIKWYDGCNDCSVVNGKLGACTEKACLVQNPTKCLEYSKSPQVSIKKGCNQWFDGCNSCSLMQDGSYACTDMACTTYKEPKCLDNSGSNKPIPNSDCKLYYDGCNTCLYDENNEPGKCTEKACIKYETPKCIDDSDQYIAPTKETGPIKIPEKEPTSEKESFCSGCELDNKCYPLGYRKSGNFCSDNYEFTSQSESDSQCENNFECSSNLCISNKCVSPSLIDKILNWFKGIFG